MMRVKIENNHAVAFLKGRIDSVNAPEIQKELDDFAAGNPGRMLEIDAGELEYISSAGLRALLRLAKSRSAPLTVRNVSPEVYDILDMTGFINLLNVRKKLREFSVEGCEIIGRGAIGAVYRVDEDTVVKVYETPDSLPMIENEQKRAKQAFLKGIPTAISYDVVKVGDKYGSVFELLRASTFHDVIQQHPEKRDEMIRQYARFIRDLHAVEMNRGELPEAKAVFTDYLARLRDILPQTLRGRLQTLFDAMPENLHVVHGDIQMKNVMLNGEEPLLIDMDTLSVGDPVFDLMGLYVTYVLFNEDEADNTDKFLGIPADVAASVWNDTIRCYFDGLDARSLEAAKKKIMVVGLVRFLYLIAVLNIGLPECRRPRIDHAIAHLQELADQVDSLEVG